ncbi:MAG: YihY/virulence factor BrkB family protein [Solirubrobacteraceae bacterium]
MSTARIARAAGRARTLARRAITEYFDDHCIQRAAAISYYSLLSLFPLAIVLAATFGLVVDDEAARKRVIEFVLDNVPLREDAGAKQLEELLRSVTSDGRGFGIAGAAGLVFTASVVMGSVRQALNAAWDAEDPRPPLQGKLIDLLLVLAAGSIVAASLAITLAVRLVASLGDSLGQPGAFAREAILLGGQLVPALLSFAVFMLLFALVPAASTRLRDAWPGALVATLGVEAAKAGFTIYLENVADYGAVYASLGSVVAFVVFIFIASNIFLFGAEVAAEWPAVRDGEAEPRPARDEPLLVRVRRALRRLVVRPDRTDPD